MAKNSFIVLVPEFHEVFINFVVELLKPSLDYVGFEAKQDEHFMDVLLRKIVLTTLCKMNYEPCVNMTRELFDKAKNSCKYKMKIALVVDHI